MQCIEFLLFPGLIKSFRSTKCGDDEVDERGKAEQDLTGFFPPFKVLRVWKGEHSQESFWLLLDYSSFFPLEAAVHQNLFIVHSY